MPLPATTLMNRLLARARFRHIQVLLRLAELGSLKRAAEAVGMTQPALTQLLADLEALLEVPLFERHARGVRPTPVCRDLLPLARQILRGMAAGAEAISARQHLGEGVVRLVASTAALHGLLVRALPAFAEADPAIQLQVKEGDTDEILFSLAREEADMLVCRQPASLPEGWVFGPLFDDAFVVACGAGHPLARRRRLRWRDLRGQTWLPSPAGTGARARLDALAEAIGEPVATCQVITRVASLTWAMLRAQPMLTLVPRSVIRHLVDAGELAVLTLDEPMPFDALGTVLPVQNVPAACQRLDDFLRRFVAEHP